MENNLFTNAHILAWLQYFADNADVDLEQVKLLDITRRCSSYFQSQIGLKLAVNWR